MRKCNKLVLIMKDITYTIFVLAALFCHTDASDLLICPETSQSFHPHPWNWSLFIECNSGASEVLVCIEGLHYDPIRECCNFPEEANCTSEEDDNETDKTCPPEGQHFFPYPYSCSQFIECNHGSYQLLNCIAGLHFNAELGWCDFPEQADCVESTPAPTTTTEEPKDEGGPVGECPPLNGMYVDFLADSEDCTIFYMCNWGTPIQMKCPSGLHFNPTLNVCDWPWNAGCKVA